MRRCSICQSSRLKEINSDIIYGKSLKSISVKYEISYPALTRHAEKHLPSDLVAAFEQRELAGQYDLLDRINGLVDTTEKVLNRSLEQENYGLALKSIGEKRAIFDLLAKISLQLLQARQVELDLQRTTEGQLTVEQKEEFQKGLKVLTDEELKLFMALADKVRGKDADTLIIEGD